jgi:hypothetical protein
MLKHTSFTVWLNLYIPSYHITLLCSLWVSIVFIHWQSQGVVHITEYFYYCSPEHHSCHRRSQQLQESCAKKLSCSAEQQKKDPAHHSAAKSTFYLWAYTSYLTAEALHVECCILYLLTYGGMLVACMIYEVWRCSRSRLYTKHVYSSILPAQKNVITTKTYYLPICGLLKKMKCFVWRLHLPGYFQK